jgi:hypothetical protein
VSVEDDKRSERPSTSKTAENVEKIWELIYEDRRRTIHELRDTFGWSFPGDLNRNLNVRRIAPSSRQHDPENHSLWLTTT